MAVLAQDKKFVRFQSLKDQIDPSEFGLRLLHGAG